jgi:hypothetical protein
MLATGRTKKSQPKQNRKSYKSWLKGYMSQLDDGRMPEDGLATATDVVLSQNGTVKPAPSSVAYGTQPPGTVMGGVFPFTRNNSGTIENYVCALIDVASVISLYYQKDGGVWTLATGKTFAAGSRGRFAQIKNAVLVASKEDNLCWLDTATMTMTVTTALTTPVLPSLAVTGMIGTNFTYFYRYTAVAAGESIRSATVSTTCTVRRDLWAAATQYIDMTMTRVTGATGYNVYMGLTSGEEYLIGFVQDPGAGSTFVFRDDGSTDANYAVLAPPTDSSALPKVGNIRVLDDQVFAWEDKDDKWKVWYGGKADWALKFTDWYGGGYIRVANGTPYIPNGMALFPTGKGDSTIMCFCRSGAGLGKRFLLGYKEVTAGSTTVQVMSSTEDNGAYGTDSPDGLVMAEDDIFYPSKDSFKKMGNKVNVPNILSTKGITDVIQGDVESLNPLAMDGCVGIYFQGRIYWAVPYGTSTTNDQIWTLDITRGGAWMLPMHVSADWMWLYEDSDGETHFCYLSGSSVYEFTQSLSTTREGVAFSTFLGSGLIKFSEDGQEWSNVEKVRFILINPQGSITANVTGKTEDAPIAPVGSQNFSPDSSITGIGEESIGMYYIGEARNAPVAYGSSRTELDVEVDEDVQWLQWQLSSSGTGVSYELSDVIIFETNIGVKD